MPLKRKTRRAKSARPEMLSRNAAIESFAASRQIGGADRRGKGPEIAT